MGGSGREGGSRRTSILLSTGVGDNETQGAAAAVSLSLLLPVLVAAAIAEAAAALPLALGRLEVNPFTAWLGSPIKSMKVTEHCGFFLPEPAQGCSVDDCQQTSSA